MTKKDIEEEKVTATVTVARLFVLTEKLEKSLIIVAIKERLFEYKKGKTVDLRVKAMTP